MQSVLFVAIAWQWYWPGAHEFGVTRDKHRLLRESPSPRMIFVGGSNVLFGMDSPTAYRETGYHPVNMGLLGSLRLNYFLREIEDSLRPGDLVVLALEYQQLHAQFAWGDLNQTVFMVQLIEQRPANALYLGFEHWKVLADRAVLPYLGLIVRSAAVGIRGSEGAAAALRARMRRSKVNRYGDLVSHRGRSPRRNIGTLELGPGITAESLGPRIERLNEFHKLCKSRGVKVVYSYPSIVEDMYPKAKPTIDLIDSELREHLTIPVIHKPEDMLFPRDLFYNTGYHLLGEGPRERTERLVEALRPYLDPQPSPVAWRSGVRFEPAAEGSDVHLTEGWWSVKEGMMLSIGVPARLRFDLEATGPGRFEFRVRPLKQKGTALTLEVSINGHSLGTKNLATGKWASVRFQARPKQLRQQNELTIVVHPKPGGLSDVKGPQVLVDRIDFRFVESKRPMSGHKRPLKAPATAADATR